MAQMFAGLEPRQEERVIGFLTRFLPYVKLKEATLIGSLATRCLLKKAGKSWKGPEQPEIDLVLLSESSLLPTAFLTTGFYLVHHHRHRDVDGGGADGFFFKVVDSVSKLSVDIFWQDPDEEVEFFQIRGLYVGIPTAASQLAKLTFDARRVLSDQPIKQAWLEQLSLLVDLTELAKAENLWRMRFGLEVGQETLAGAIQKIKKKAAREPKLVMAAWPPEETDRVCAECAAVTDRPLKLTPLEAIKNLTADWI